MKNIKNTVVNESEIVRPMKKLEPLSKREIISESLLNVGSSSFKESHYFAIEIAMDDYAKQELEKIDLKVFLNNYIKEYNQYKVEAAFEHQAEKHWKEKENKLINGFIKLLKES